MTKEIFTPFVLGNVLSLFLTGVRKIETQPHVHPRTINAKSSVASRYRALNYPYDAIMKRNATIYSDNLLPIADCHSNFSSGRLSYTGT